MRNITMYLPVRDAEFFGTILRAEGYAPEFGAVENGYQFVEVYADEVGIRIINAMYHTFSAAINWERTGTSSLHWYKFTIDKD